MSNDHATTASIRAKMNKAKKSIQEAKQTKIEETASAAAAEEDEAESVESLQHESETEISEEEAAVAAPLRLHFRREANPSKSLYERLCRGGDFHSSGGELRSKEEIGNYNSVVRDSIHSFIFISFHQ